MSRPNQRKTPITRHSATFQTLIFKKELITDKFFDTKAKCIAKKYKSIAMPLANLEKRSRVENFPPICPVQWEAIFSPNMGWTLALDDPNF